ATSLWLKYRVILPLFSLSDAMNRFSPPRVHVHVPETGALELRLMARRFNEMAEVLVKRQRAGQVWFEAVVHDLREPLAVMQTAVNLMEREGAPAERTEALLKIVPRQIDRLTRVVADALEEVLIQTGRLHLHLEPFDLRDLAQEVVASFPR